MCQTYLLILRFFGDCGVHCLVYISCTNDIRIEIDADNKPHIARETLVPFRDLSPISWVQATWITFFNGGARNWSGDGFSNILPLEKYRNLTIGTGKKIIIGRDYR